MSIFMDKINSIKSKVKTISHVGLKPYEAGKHNFYYIDDEAESLAKERLKTCVGCEFFVDEPIDFLRVKDEKIPELSNKMCGNCGCTLAYKIRQSIQPCDKWQQEQNI